jgi:hypothetical protein
MGDSGKCTMDGGKAAPLQWATVAAMGNGRCHNGRQQQQRHNPDGRQWWWCNGWQDGSDRAMAIAMNGGSSKDGNSNGNIRNSLMDWVKMEIATL